MRRTNLRRPQREAFTLVELLVVITIIGMLMAMVFPALGAIMAHLDKTKCANQQEQIAKGIAQYVQSKQRYPGYATKVMMSGQGGNSTQRRPELKSWIVASLEYLDKPRFDAIKKNLDTQTKEMRNYVCPSANRVDEQINYVANCGRKDASGTSGNKTPDWKANGVFMKESLQTTSGMRDEIVRSTDIPDGESYTILISENLQAQQWTKYEEPDIGMIWDATNPEFPAKPSMGINVQRDDPVPQGNYDYARPSSNHPQGVVIAYCDGRTLFLSDQVEYGAVYCKLMTPNGKEAKEPGQDKLVHEFFRKPLDEKLINP